MLASFNGVLISVELMSVDGELQKWNKQETTQIIIPNLKKFFI
jgi:hypothetical protein